MPLPILLDCTLRDGGYYNAWDFGKETVDEYIKAVNALPVDYIEVGYRNKPSKDVIKNSDIVTLHIPYTKENRYIINKSNLTMMKQTAILLNISRGGIVNEQDLICALKGKRITGAGIDCFEKEPYTGALTAFENVVLISHIGSYAKEAWLQQELDSVQNILKAAG